METPTIDLQRIAAWVGEELEKTANGIRQRHLDAGQKASGRTAASIRSEVEYGAGGVHGIIWGRAPFTDLEEGQPPGERPGNFYRIILDWMHFKGIHGTPVPYKRKESENWRPMYTPEDRGDRRLAYFIAKKIEEEGTRLWRGEAPKTDIYSTEIASLMERVGSELVSIFGASFEHIHSNNALLNDGNDLRI